MPEVHVIGEIETATGFPSQSLFCKWKIVADEAYWEIIGGKAEGQTQVDFPMDDETAVFAHPIDIHYKVNAVKGWPKLRLQVWNQDTYGRNQLYGYGFCHIPTSPGMFDMEVVTWRPVGSGMEEFKAQFLGGSCQLRNEELVSSREDRYRLKTTAMGKVQIHFSIILKDFAKHGVHW